MIFDKATIKDIGELTVMRIAYLEEDSGAMNEDMRLVIQNNLPDYFIRHLNKDIFAYVAREQKKIVSCAFLLVVEKPMSPKFVTGKTGTVLNVYTRPGYRRKGYAGNLMRMLLEDAAEKNVSIVELKATEDGYKLYKSLGFVDEVSKYHQMKWVRNPLN